MKIPDKKELENELFVFINQKETKDKKMDIIKNNPYILFDDAILELVKSGLIVLSFDEFICAIKQSPEVFIKIYDNIDKIKTKFTISEMEEMQLEATKHNPEIFKYIWEKVPNRLEFLEKILKNIQKTNKTLLSNLPEPYKAIYKLKLQNYVS